MRDRRNPNALQHREDMIYRAYYVENRFVRLITKYAHEREMNSSEALNDILKRFFIADYKEMI